MASDFLKTFRPRIIDSLKDYNKEKFFTDFMSGIIVAIVALPLAIAFGIASGVSPEKGLITAIIGGFLVSFLGGSSVQIGGPTGAFIVIMYGIIQNFGVEGLAIATIMAGIILIILGFLKLGTIITFIPYPIVVGFTSGIAVTIFTSQIKDLFGLSIDKIPSDFISKWNTYFQNIDTITPWALCIGIISILLIVFTPKISKKIPGSLVAIILATIIAYAMRHYCDITTIETIGDKFTIAASLPSPNSVSFNMETVNNLLPSAFTIAILAAIESLLSATVADGMINEKHNSNTELIAQGVANIAAPIFGGIPVVGAMARTMTNINNGGRTPIAGMVHAIILLVILLFLGSLTKHIPMACLAGVLVVVSYNMSEWRSFKSLIKSRYHRKDNEKTRSYILNYIKHLEADSIVLITTFLLTVIFDLTIAIEIGLLLAVFLFMKRIMEVTEVSVLKDKLNPSDKENSPQSSEESLKIPQGVEVYEIDGPFFFGIANKFEESMRIIGDNPKVRIIRMRKVPFIDLTGIHNLESLCKKSHSENIEIILSGVNLNVKDALENSGFDNLIGKENICKDIYIALDRAEDFIKKKNIK